MIVMADVTVSHKTRRLKHTLLRGPGGGGSGGDGQGLLCQRRPSVGGVGDRRCLDVVVQGGHKDGMATDHLIVLRTPRGTHSSDPSPALLALPCLALPWFCSMTLLFSRVVKL